MMESESERGKSEEEESEVRSCQLSEVRVQRQLSTLVA